MPEPSDLADPAAETIDDAPTPVSVTAPLRVAGFLATVLGAALMGGGSLMHWVTIHDPSDVNGVLDPKFKGIDIRNGRLALGAAAVLLFGLMVLRVSRSRSTQETVAMVMVVAAVIGIAFSGAFLVDAGHRFITVPTETGVLGFGVLMTLAGAVVGLLGAILDLAWSVAPH
jgi:hypothetical protein